MTALTLNLPDEKLHRLEVVAQARGASVAELFEEMSTVMLAEADAETRFRLRAERGAGREARGLELLRKSAGDAVEGRGV
jgi:hypothetical protein